MKKILLTTVGLAAMSLAGVTSAQAQTPFTPSNLVVNTIGDGVTALTAASTRQAIREYTTTGTLVQTIGLPTTMPGALTASGVATSEGYINTFGDTLYVPGYNIAPGTASIAGTTSAVAPRGVGTISFNGTIGTLLTAGVGYTGNNIRSGIGTGTLTFASGTATTHNGVRHFTSANASMRISSAVTNVRNLEIYNNHLMFSTGAGVTGIYTLGAIPALNLTAADLNPASLLIGSASPYGFYVNPSLGVAFVADDGLGASGGIRRFDFNTLTSVWDNTWSFRLDTTTNVFSSLTSGVASVRGLAAEFNASLSRFNIYATTTPTSNNQLIGFSDGLVSTLAAGHSYTVIASAGANNVFRGVDLAPIPEPGTWILLLIGASAVIIRRKLGALEA